jgi:parallel beta-helix repeat protein
VSGPFGVFGILLNTRRNVTVKNCDVSGFLHGVGLLTSVNSTITGNTSHNNSLAGFVLEGGSNNSLSSNTADANSWNGFQLSFPSNTTLENNVATDNGGTVEADHAVAVSNVFFDSNSNVMSKNAGHGNTVFDARDAGTANVWTKNNFGTTAGI